MPMVEYLREQSLASSASISATYSSVMRSSLPIAKGQEVRRSRMWLLLFDRGSEESEEVTP